MNLYSNFVLLLVHYEVVDEPIEPVSISSIASSLLSDIVQVRRMMDDECICKRFWGTLSYVPDKERDCGIGHVIRELK
jgi:hypothetical protein